MEDEDAPVLRNVSYKCKPEIFQNDPRGEEVAIEAALLELSEFWRSFAKGFTYFGCNMKRDGKYVVDMSMVFRNKFYLKQYKKEIRAPILKKFQYLIDISTWGAGPSLGHNLNRLPLNETIVKVTSSPGNLTSSSRKLSIGGGAEAEGEAGEGAGAGRE